MHGDYGCKYCMAGEEDEGEDATREEVTKMANGGLEETWGVGKRTKKIERKGRFLKVKEEKHLLSWSRKHFILIFRFLLTSL